MRFLTVSNHYCKISYNNVMRKISFKKNIIQAFTLSEAVLVMIIIGVIASLLIASLAPYNSSQKGFNALAAKAQGDLEQVFNHLLINDSDYDDILRLKDSSGTFTITEQGAIDRFVPVIQKYIQNNGKAVDMTKEADYFGSEIMHYDKTSTNKKLSDTYKNFYFGNNGVLFGFKLNDNCTTQEELEYLPERTSATVVADTCGSFFVDVNGYKKPNKLGSDQFIFPFDKKFMKYI